ncbi:MAG TPA: hypothetical protein VKA84_06235, partial [Gemmatimonadaceae bacterium]|nr:hypothetical protein [Gemmatimonadaceae bacterium]
GAGFGVLTWDWRGTGDSRPARLRGFPATMRDWATKDLAGAISWAEARAPAGAALLGVGHSFGGQAMGLAPNRDRLRALVTVAAQSGYFGHWPAPARYGYALLWHVGMPVLARAVGYFPAHRLGLGEDLPRGVALEWARWCRRPEYLGDWSGHAAFAAPLLTVGFDDDPIAPPRAVEALHVRYGSPDKRRRQVRAEELGVRRIGHFGFFRPTAEPLWREVVEWVEGQGLRD